MSLKDKINEDIKKAMLSKDKVSLEALRAIKSALLLAETDKNATEIDPLMEIKILQKLVKQRVESAEIYKNQNRKDLYETEILQIQVIEKYLPEKMDDNQLKEFLINIIKQENATSIKDMGKVMAIASKELSGKADGKRISDILKQILGN
ncbi:MAG: glutamyl-tRNA amidotransferase, partial [Bacteroidetes bacterium GWE2_29_8]